VSQLEKVNTPGKVQTRKDSGRGLRLFVVFLAAAMSWGPSAIALAAQSTEPGQQTEDAIKSRVAKINLNEKEYA
jgi:hypothetical protein